MSHFFNAKNSKKSYVLFIGVLLTFVSGCSTNSVHQNDAKRQSLFLQSSPKKSHKPVAETLPIITQTYSADKISLQDIADIADVRLSDLQRLNPVYQTDTLLETEDLILLPPKNFRARGDILYKVQPKDGLGKLAKHFQISLHTLLAKNNLRMKDGLRIGQILLIPISLHDSQKYIWPIKNPQHISRFRNFRLNPGLAMQTNKGDTIFAIAAGKVIYSDSLRRLGNVLIIEHADKRQSVYANCSKILVRLGDSVAQGDRIAEAGFQPVVGSYGLYFELRDKGKILPAEEYLPILKIK